MKQSLGLLEVCGLALAISCADIMAKSASITLLALEKTNGSGWMVIKITGDVASVQAAITTGAHFAEQRNGLVAHKVIARPGEGILLAETPPPSVIEPEPEASEIADVVSEAPAEEAPAGIRTGQLQSVSGSKMSAPEGRTSYALHSFRQAR
ncbi:propanediol utilization polyhedral bodies protein [Salmonella enterica]|nr:propanediol utilization polyhedral bodies protein [Salmonella enterica]